MIDLKEMNDEQIIELIRQGIVTNAELTDAGICPTCFNKEHGEITARIIGQYFLLLIIAKSTCFASGNYNRNHFLSKNFLHILLVCGKDSNATQPLRH